MNGYILSTSGIIDDGKTIVISGRDFGSNSLRYSWTGNKIESGTPGTSFSMASWTNHTDAPPDRSAVKYDNKQYHSGQQSLYIDFSDGAAYSGWITYDNGTNIGNSYFTFWVRMHWDQSLGGQWKIFRFSNIPSPITSSPQIYFYKWYIPVNDPLNRTTYTDNLVGCNASESLLGWWRKLENDEVYPGVCYDNGDDYRCLPHPSSLPGPPDNEDVWVRVEIYINAGTQGNYDGTFKYWFQKPDVICKLIINYDGTVKIYDTDTSGRFRYLHLGQYVGDGFSSAEVWYDDIFIQTESGQSRIEIGNAPTWTACTHREIQIPTSWSDTAINATINHGSFEDGETAYLFVIDSNGNPSMGYPIVFNKNVTIPKAPSNLIIR